MRGSSNVEQGWWRSERTFVDDFLDRADRLPDRTAIVGYASEAGSRVELSYGELAELVDRCALGLLDLGVRPGDVVSFQLPNWWQFAAVAFGCARIGAVMNPILPILREREVAFILQALHSRVYLGPARFRGFEYGEMIRGLSARLPDLEHVLLVDEERHGAMSVGELMAQPADGRTRARALDDLRPSPDAVAQVQFTSGTTGPPKGVVHTYNTLYAAYRAVSLALGLDDRDVVLAPSTMAHQTAFLSGCCMPLAEGMKAVYDDVWDPDRARRAIAHDGVTFASGATPFMLDLCQAIERDPGHHDLRSLRYFKSGGAVVPLALRERVRDLTGATVVMAWGMTENGVCTIVRPDAGAADTSDGTPLPWVELKLTPVPGVGEGTGRSGRLWVKSASQCIGYVPDHDEFTRAHDHDGWFDTGDIAEQHADGSIHIIGRVKDLIIRGGENIPVAEVEALLREHEGVADVAVVGVPDDRLGERACAVVEVRPGAPAPDLAELTAHLHDRGMAKPYWPERLVVLDQLPRTASQKVRKAALGPLVMDASDPHPDQAQGRGDGERDRSSRER